MAMVTNNDSKTGVILVGLVILTILALAFSGYLLTGWETPP